MFRLHRNALRVDTKKLSGIICSYPILVFVLAQNLSGIELT